MEAAYSRHVENLAAAERRQQRESQEMADALWMREIAARNQQRARKRELKQLQGYIRAQIAETHAARKLEAEARQEKVAAYPPLRDSETIYDRHGMTSGRPATAGASGSGSGVSGGGGGGGFGSGTRAVGHGMAHFQRGAGGKSALLHDLKRQIHRKRRQQKDERKRELEEEKMFLQTVHREMAAHRRWKKDLHREVQSDLTRSWARDRHLHAGHQRRMGSAAKTGCSPQVKSAMRTALLEPGFPQSMPSSTHPIQLPYDVTSPVGAKGGAPPPRFGATVAGISGGKPHPSARSNMSGAGVGYDIRSARGSARPSTAAAASGRRSGRRF